MNALANEDVGEYLNEHFVATFQKVGAFRIVNGQKQGGNVAGYFCTPEGRVLHVVAGPVDACTLFHEASWVVETWKMAQLRDSDAEDVFRQAHADRLRQEHGMAGPLTTPAAQRNREMAIGRNVETALVARTQSSNGVATRCSLRPRPSKTPGVPPGSSPVRPVSDSLVDNVDLDTLLRSGGLAPQGKVHFLLAAYPLVKIERIYQAVFKHILNEEVSTNPVMQATPQDRHRPRGPTPEEIRDRAQEDRLRRARNNPPRQEVLSAKSLNVLLIDLQQLEDRDIRGPDLPLTAELLGQINVSTGSSTAQVGLVKQKRLSWPLALRAAAYDDDRQLINSLVAKTYSQALRGTPDSASVKAMVTAVENLEAGLALTVKDLPARQYVEGRRFLRCLKEELEVLQLPDARQYVNGTYAARGKSVQELIQHMSAHGLRFAPAASGHETAYLALHRALAAYDLKAHATANEMIIDPIEPIVLE